MQKRKTVLYKMIGSILSAVRAIVNKQHSTGKNATYLVQYGFPFLHFLHLTYFFLERFYICVNLCMKHSGFFLGRSD